METLEESTKSEKLLIFRNKILVAHPSNRSILILKPHAFADCNFTEQVLNEVLLRDFELATNSRSFKNEDEVNLLHTILTIDDKIFGNDWKKEVYQESLSGPFHAIGIVGPEAHVWALEYKEYIRETFCIGKGNKREIVRNFIHTPDDAGDRNPEEFLNSVEIFFPEDIK